MIHFQDSKAFEKMESRVSHVFKKFKPDCETLEYGEILAEYGIYHTPNYVYLKGNLIVSIGKETIELSSFRQGLGISGEDIGRIRFCNTDNVRKVITIENLTTYFRWQEDDSLVDLPWRISQFSPPCAFTKFMAAVQRHVIIISGISTSAGLKFTAICVKRRGFRLQCTKWIWKPCGCMKVMGNH